MMTPRPNLTCLLFALALFLVMFDGTNQERPDCICKRSTNCTCRTLGSSILRHQLLCEEPGISLHRNEVLTLDLSRNRIINISRGTFRCLPGLRTLSLAYNKINVLHYDAFIGLERLTLLDISYNPLVRFHGNLSGLLPELSTVDATGILHWQMGRELQQLTKLQRISGQPFIPNYCSNCWIVKSQNTTLIPYKREVSQHLNLSFIKYLNGSSFQFRCVSDFETKRCSERFFRFGFKTAVNIFYWKTILTVFDCKCVLGVLTVFFNAIAFFTIITSKRLRGNVSMCLVSNMAFSDLIMGMYDIVIYKHLNSNSQQYLFVKGLNIDCWKIGFLWVLGQAGSVQTTFLLTLERYCVIVYTLNPDIRLSRRMALCFMAFSWFIAVILISLAFYYNFYSRSFMCNPFNIVNGLSEPVGIYSFTIASGALMFFLLSFVLYFQIYFVSKRAAQSAGAKRESKLAKRIALIVFSNMFFFFIPVLCIGIVSLAITNSNQEYNANAFRSMVDVFLLLCMSINSCCNPVLHAFRQHQFKAVFKQRITAVRNSASFVFARLCECCGVSLSATTARCEKSQTTFNKTSNSVGPVTDFDKINVKAISHVGLA